MTVPDDTTTSLEGQSSYVSSVSTIGLFVDHPGARSLIESSLIELGHQVLSPLPGATESDDVLAVDLLIVDQQSAARAGVYFDRGIEPSRVPTLVLLPMGAPSDQWFNAGFDDVLRLPLSTPELAARLNSYLRLRPPLSASYLGYRDQTQQRVPAGALYESEKRLQALIGQSLDASVVINDAGRYVDANPAACRLLGVSLDELRSMHMPDFFFPGKQDFTLQKFFDFVARGQGGGVLRLRRKDGQPIYIEYQATANFWPGLHLAVLRDVTARVQAETALRESEERFRTMFDNAAIGIGLVTFDGVPVACNRAFEQMLGYTFEELKKIGIASVTHPDDVARETVLVREVLNGIHDSYQLEKRYIRRDGGILWARLTVSLAPSGANGRPLVIGMVEDITDRKRAEQALRESEERFRMMFEGAAVGIVLTNSARELLTANSALQTMLGYSEYELRVLPRSTWVHPGDLGKDDILFGELVAGLRDQYHVEKRYRHRDGGELWTRLTVSLVQSQTTSAPMVIMILENITDRKRVEEQLLHDAFHDSLTGLPNRALFSERLDHLLARSARRADYLFAVLFLDLDRFKIVNDSLGHLKGDQFLITIAQRLEACVRPGDTVARLGGDEFTVLLEDLNHPADARRVADRIQEALAAPVVLDGVDVYTSASIGIALSSDEYERSEHYLRDADAAMYYAKSLGRSRYEMFDSKMHIEAVTRLQLESELRHAIDRQEFIVHYQPIISLEDGNIAWFEALVRWQHPQRGLLSPGEFIPMAEETGLIVLIDRFVLQEACRQTHEWQRRFPEIQRISVSVNLSGKQFSEPDLSDYIRSVLQQTGLDGECLRVEITESVVMENVELARVTLRQLRQLGVHVDMDDFGTGYSSLGVLHSFPLNKLKIDRSFVDSIVDEADRTEVVLAIVAMAHGLHLEVIAEGVESIDQLAKLRRMGCDYGQGYFFARPLAPIGIEALIQANQIW